MAESLEQRILKIEERNARVEGNKSWETSFTRRFTISVLTYLTVVAYHFVIGADNPFLVSIVPVIGFVLSTISLQFIRGKFFADNGQTNK